MDQSSFLKDGLRVLVVDSHPDSIALLSMLFAAYGVETIVATGVEEALALIQQRCPDLLLSELLLPDEDGYSLISKVKALETTDPVRVPSIALTTCASARDRLNAITAGFCTHLPKPLDIDELIATVTSLLGAVPDLAVTYH